MVSLHKSVVLHFFVLYTDRRYLTISYFLVHHFNYELFSVGYFDVSSILIPLKDIKLYSVNKQV
jgi:hypothetical protein